MSLKWIRTPASVLDLPLVERAELAFKEAVAEVIEEHVRKGLPIYVWRNGKVAEVSSEELRARHQPGFG